MAATARQLRSLPPARTAGVRALANALLKGKADGLPTLTAGEALEVAEAVRGLVREELGRAFGEAAMQLSRPERGM